VIPTNLYLVGGRIAPEVGAMRREWHSAMKNKQRKEYLLRNAVMNLLSDDEVTKVSTAETAARLSDGDEYVDLEQLCDGVRRAPSTSTPMGRVLPRSAVHQDTWNKILSQLAIPFLADSDPSEPLLETEMG